MELKFLCTKYERKGLGLRFMSQIIQWASKKKFYSEIATMSDIAATGFFEKNEFVFRDLKEF